MSFPRTLDLFCRVVDNFGDIGVCWRLARQLAAEHGIAVTLWVDDLRSFRRICKGIDADLDAQTQAGVLVRRWPQSFGPVAPEDVADAVVEGFGCELPAGYVAAMARRDAPTAWINLEYLSAEPWVEDCHAMQSVHPALGLKKYFFFPGFTARTGGLLLERDLFARRTAFRSDPRAVAGLLSGIGVSPAEGAALLSLFCYPHAPLGMLFEALQAGGAPAHCLVPEGVAVDAVRSFAGSAAAGSSARRGALTVQVLPFLDQPDYDRLLWACDLNFVRGEDSMVRAQWAARPFVWHIYPQQEDAHLVKLHAFLDRYTEGLAAPAAAAVRQAWDAWNGKEGAPVDWWTPLRRELPALETHAADWAGHLLAHGDLASNLVEFLRKIC